MAIIFTTVFAEGWSMGTEAGRYLGDHLLGITTRFRIADLEKEIDRLAADNERLRDALSRMRLERDLAEAKLKLCEPKI